MSAEPTALTAPARAAEARGPEVESLTINEIFVSIQGESTWAGNPCVFVRTTGCPLRCRWCDTEYAFFEGQRFSLAQVLEQTCGYGVELVEITGGEPLAQPGVPALARALLQRGKTVLVETSGALDISVLPDGVHRIMDLKCPGSGECARNDLDNLARLHPGDEVKFVIADRRDYEWARTMILEHGLAADLPVLLSPVHGEMDPTELARWILDDTLPVRLQLPLHKLLWPNAIRGI